MEVLTQGLDQKWLFYIINTVEDIQSQSRTRKFTTTLTSLVDTVYNRLITIRNNDPWLSSFTPFNMYTLIKLHMEVAIRERYLLLEEHHPPNCHVPTKVEPTNAETSNGSPWAIEFEWISLIIHALRKLLNGNERTGFRVLERCVWHQLVIEECGRSYILSSSTKSIQSQVKTYLQSALEKGYVKLKVGESGDLEFFPADLCPKRLINQDSVDSIFMESLTELGRLDKEHGDLAGVLINPEAPSSQVDNGFVEIKTIEKYILFAYATELNSEEDLTRILSSCGVQHENLGNVKISQGINSYAYALRNLKQEKSCLEMKPNAKIYIGGPVALLMKKERRVM